MSAVLSSTSSFSPSLSGSAPTAADSSLSGAAP
eukprot:CAMPEP_0176449946 /NCGR_PEP_ID=MMETSP0127-20121128/26824_1 /TAXON_ID=938130 /ORGANISM="Platyophrya macrostoma, Strain WH" /LENGTH=32 /DNA_ID= /DNA_START= /DNA_END= /DNA_ORIENTATION=